MKKKSFKSYKSIVVSGCQMMKLQHVEMSDASEEMFTKIPLKHYLYYIHFKDWIYKKTTLMHSILSKTKSQHVIKDHKPYWASLHKGVITLYYEKDEKETKERYQMIKVKDLTKVGKTKLSFTNPNKDEHLVYKICDHRQRCDWYYLIETMNSAYKMQQLDLKANLLHKAEVEKEILSKGICTQIYDFDTIVTKVTIDYPKQELFTNLYDLLNK